jgi:hypothetical protein
LKKRIPVRAISYFLGKYLEEIYTQFDFSKEQLYKVSLLLKIIGDKELIDPHHA